MGYISDLRKIIGTRPIFLVGSCVLVFNEKGQLLLQKRTDSFDWGTIGGSLELGETFEEAAARELHEEAGLRADQYELLTVLSGKDLYYKYPHGDEVYNVIAVFVVKNAIGEPTINDNEGMELRYFSLDEPLFNLNPTTNTILRKIGYL